MKFIYLIILLLFIVFFGHLVVKSVEHFSQMSSNIFIITTQKQKQYSIDFVNSFATSKIEDNIVIFDAILNEDHAKGCKASHLEVLKQIDLEYSKTGIDKINYIFEDDVIPLYSNPRQISDKFIKSVNNLPYDILYLGYCAEQYPTKTDINVNDIPVLKLSTPRCTHSYIIKSSKAKKFIDLINSKSDDEPIDEIFGRSVYDNINISYGIQLFKQPWF